jgi:hypothetical protein
MCPVCLATAAWIAAGVGSTGGISALVVTTFRGKNKLNQAQGEPDEHENTPDRLA